MAVKRAVARLLEAQPLALQDVRQRADLLQNVLRQRLVDLDQGDRVAAGPGAAEMEGRDVYPGVAERGAEIADQARPVIVAHVQHVRAELRLDDPTGYEVGQELGADLLTPGERVDVTAVSKGKGTAGTMERHGFGGLGASHGAHRVHRAPGSIGACATPARVFKGTRMAGRKGAERVTTLNLEVVQADPEREVILVRGSVPGPRGGLVLIRNAVKGGA